ncbi:hypothetical protein EDD15DRAFT_2572721, partial [Pisolithus albus]
MIMISTISFFLGPRPHQTLALISIFFSLFGNIAFSDAVCYIDSTWGFFHSFYRLHDSAEYYCGKDALGSLLLPSGMTQLFPERVGCREDIFALSCDESFVGIRPFLTSTSRAVSHQKFLFTVHKFSTFGSHPSSVSGVGKSSRFQAI